MKKSIRVEVDAKEKEKMHKIASKEGYMNFSEYVRDKCLNRRDK